MLSWKKDGEGGMVFPGAGLVGYLMKYLVSLVGYLMKNLRRLDIGKCLEDWGKISGVAIGMGRYLGEFRGSRYRGREIRDWG